MNAVFLTKKEAEQFITERWGENPYRKPVQWVDERAIHDFDINELPGDLSFAGDLEAVEVEGEDLVAWFEDGGDYTVAAAGYVEHYEAWHYAQKRAEKLVDLAEELNAPVEVVCHQDGEYITTYTPEIDEEEEKASERDFIVAVMRRKLAEQIKSARNTQCLSIRQLAAKAGVNKQQVINVESGFLAVTIDTVAAIVSALGLDIQLSKMA